MNVWLTGTLDRALRTALQTFLAYLTAAELLADIDWLTAASATVLAVLVSVLTNLIAAPSFGDLWIYQVMERAMKTFAQSLVAFLGTTVLITDVDWPTAFSAALTAALYSAVSSTLTTRVGDVQAKGNVDLVPPTGQGVRST